MAYNYPLEIWVEYGVGSFVAFLRLYVRARTGFRKWQADDYLMIFAWVVFTVSSVVRNQISKGSSIKVGPNTPPDKLRAHQISQKYNFAIWVINIFLLWSLKACLLVLYKRILRNFMKRFITLTAWFIGLTAVAAILELFLHCLPLSGTWISYPVQPKHCQTGITNFLVVGLLNVITDLVLFGIACSVLFQVNLPLKKKIAVGVVLCSGLLTVVASILRNVAGYMAEKDAKNGTWNKDLVHAWACREIFTAMVVVNIPCLRPLISSTKWITNQFSKGSRKDKTADSDGTGGTDKSGNSSACAPPRKSSSALFFKKYSPASTFGLTTVGNTQFEPEHDEKRPSLAVSSLSVPEKAYSPPGTNNGLCSDDIERDADRHSRQPSHSEIMESLEKEMDKQGLQHGILPVAN